MFRLKSGIKTAALITAFILSTGAIVSCGGQENNNSLPTAPVILHPIRNL